ncbi:MAG TPA: AAA family ATPase [Thermoleophilaceae bacterium]|nr:AAA family ATPase [Thermoleophilaceae bacterium]
MGTTQTVSLLFTDLVGSTTLATRLGPSAADDLRRDHFGVLRRAIRDHGGTEVKNLGDGLMVSFDGVAAAVNCAVSMQQGLERRNRRASPQLDVRIGVAVGDAVPEAGDWFGPPVVEAARLCDAAEGGSILVTDAVHMLLAGAHAPAMRALGPLELKGLPGAVEAWSVEWERLPPPTGAPPLPPRLRGQPATGLVGRGAERTQLAAAWAEAREGARRIVLMCGEPGIGKTRLAAHMAHEARREGAIVLYGRCDDDVGVPYQPWREALGHLVEVAPSELLQRHVDRHGGELIRLVPDLAERLPEVPQPQSTDPETERYLLFGAATGILQEASQSASVLLVLDDLHWAGLPTLTVLKHLHVAAPAMPMLVLATYRTPDGTGSGALATLLADLRREPGVERMELAGLEAHEAKTLLETEAGHALGERGGALAGDLHRETAGNPFFLGEMVRHLVESNAITRDAEGRWTAGADLAALKLPASIHEVVSGRVARLGPDAERILRTAAVIGRDFDLDLLEDVCGVGEDELLDTLDAATAGALLTESPEQNGRFSFAHALVSHVLSERLTGARRARLHERIAGALEQRAGSNGNGYPRELASHWAAVPGAEAQAKARGYAVDAGRAALAQLAPDEAVSWFEQALSIDAALPEGERATRSELLLDLGRAQLQAGIPEFRETLLDAARSAEAAGDIDRLVRAALSNSRGYFSTAGSVDHERIAVLEAALDHAATGDPRRAHLLALLAAELLWSADHERRRALSDEAVRLARTGGDRAALVDALTLRVTAVWWPETLAERLETTAEMVALADALGDPVRQFWALVWRGMTSVQGGDAGDADRCLELLGRLADRLGQPRLHFVLGTQRTWRAQLAGQLHEAEGLADEAVALGMDAGEPDALSLYAAQLGPIRWQQDRLAELTDLLAQIAEDVPAVAVFASMSALAELEAGRHEIAREQLERAALDGFAGLPADPVQLGSFVLWAEVAARLGAKTAAAALLQRLEPWRDQVVLDALGTLGSASRGLGLAAATLGRSAEADAHFAHALGVHERMGAPSLAARTQLDWGASLMGGGDGDHLRGRELLARAADGARTLGLTALEQRAHAAARAGGRPL